MFTRIGKLLRVRVLITTMALVMMIFSLTATPTPSTVNACCPMYDHETLITYYTDATLTTWSGMRRTLCNGYWTQIGTSTAYYTVEYPPCECEVYPC